MYLKRRVAVVSRDQSIGDQVRNGLYTRLPYKPKEDFCKCVDFDAFPLHVLQDSDDEKDNKAVKKPEPEPETPSKTPPQSPPKAKEKPPKAANAVKTPTPGKPGGKPPKPEHREEVVKSNRELAVVKTDNGGRDLLDVLKEVDDRFLKAAESGEEVSRMLETKKAHYHSSFSDNLRGTI